MTTRRFVHAADVHLDSPLRGLDRYEGAPVDRLRGATRRALENLVTLCIEERAGFLVIAGDLYDGGWRDSATQVFFANELNRLRRENIRVFIVRGNHDAASEFTKHLRWPDNVHDFDVREAETKILEHLGVAVHGFGFEQRVITEDLASRYPHAATGLLNVGVLHTSATGRAGHEVYAPCSVATLASKGYDYWALGHVHAREVLSQSPWVVFPGNLQGRHARETGDKGATVVDFDDRGISSVAHRSLDTVRWVLCDVDCAGAASLDDAVELARDEITRGVASAGGRAVAMRVRLRGPTRAHAALARDEAVLANELRSHATAGGDAAWLEKIVLATRPASDMPDLASLGPVTDVLKALEDVKKSDAMLLELAAEIADLKSLGGKLAADLRDGDDGVRVDDPGYLRRVLDDVEKILFAQLALGDAPGPAPAAANGASPPAPASRGAR